MPAENTAGKTMSTAMNYVPSVHQHLDSSFLEKLKGLHEPVVLTFGEDPRPYTFPRNLLTLYLKYFRGALQLDAPEGYRLFSESVHRRIHLQDITAASLTAILSYISGHDDPFNACTQLDQWLDIVIAADYLGMAPAWFRDVFEADHIEWLQYFLLFHRDQIASNHLRLVTSHPAFRARRIWGLFAKAGVRPLMQQYMLGSCTDFTDEWMERETFGDDLQVWRKTLRYFRRLFKGHVKYRRAVHRAACRQSYRLIGMKWTWYSDSKLVEDPLLIPTHYWEEPFEHFPYVHTKIEWRFWWFDDEDDRKEHEYVEFTDCEMLQDSGYRYWFMEGDSWCAKGASHQRNKH